MGQWNPEILDRYLAPGISQFTKANIPDLATMHTEAHWHANHFLNNVFRASFAFPSRLYVFNILYRSQVCFDRYQQARAETQEFLSAGEPRNPAIRKYFHALSTWEMVFLNWQMAVDMWRKFVEDDAFVEGDGSSEDRAVFERHLFETDGETIRDDIAEVCIAIDDALSPERPIQGLKALARWLKRSPDRPSAADLSSRVAGHR